MDLLLWHKDIKEKYKDNTQRLWNANFEYQGKVCMHSKWHNVFYAGKYQLENKSGILKDGDWVGIRVSGPNKNAKLSPIDKFVFETNYIIL